MATIDNTLAAQVPTFDAMTPLKQVAQYQAGQQELAQNQFKQAQVEIGSEMRGLQSFVNTPDFPNKWREAADRLRSRGVINDQIYNQWANSPSPLLMKSIISQTESPELAFRREEAARAQRNSDREFGLSQRRLAIAEDQTPEGFRKKEDGTYEPLPGGPQDPSYLARASQAAGKKNLPSGFEISPDGGLRPIKGGPADPEYLRQKGDRQNAPSGYVWNDPADPSKGLTAIPGGPGEKVDAEVASRLGLAKSFLGQLPDIKKRVENGELTGPIDAGQAYLGMGGPGEIRRQIDSGAEALLRMLTGAGMNKEEAANYVRRYQFSPTDKKATVISKLNQLERELNSVGETVGKGRGGWTPPGKTPAKPSGLGKDADTMLDQAREAISAGAPKGAVIKRLEAAGISGDYL